MDWEKMAGEFYIRLKVSFQKFVLFLKACFYVIVYRLKK